MKKFIRTFALIAAATAVMVFGGAIAAAPPGQDVQAMIQSLRATGDPQAAFDQLSAADQAAVVEALRVASIGGTTVTTETVTPVGVAGGDAYTAADAGDEECARQKKITTYTDGLGVTLWRYTSSTMWCWDGTQITNDPYFTREGWAGWPWEFVGHIDKSESGGQGDWVHRDYTQGHFKWCVGGNFPCPKHRYPKLSKRQYGDGSSS